MNINLTSKEIENFIEKYPFGAARVYCAQNAMKWVPYTSDTIKNAPWERLVGGWHGMAILLNEGIK